MNNKNISLFNYVYSSMFEEEQDDKVKWSEFKAICLEKMKYVPYDFIMNYETLVTINRKNMWQDLGGNKETIGKFVILNFIGTKEYINYKINEIKSLIKNYGINSFKNIGDIFENMCNEAIREVLEECQNKDLITFDNSIFRYASNRLYDIIYDNIKIVINESKNNSTGNIFYINNNGQLVTQVGNNNNANIEVINDDKLFEILAEKLEAIRVELKNKDCEDKIKELEKAINKKDKKSALEIISHLAGIGSFIATGINLLPLG